MTFFKEKTEMFQENRELSWNWKLTEILLKINITGLLGVINFEMFHFHFFIIFFQSFVDNSKRTPTKLSYFGKDQAASQFSQRLMADSRNLFKISWNLFLVLQKLFLQGPRLKKWAKKQLNQVKTSTKIDTFFSQNLAKMQPEFS